MTQSVLETSGLRKSFAGILALDGVSVAIGEGELVGIIGANGAGKTTFVNVVTGYVKPDAGAIRFMGREISRLSPREVTRLGVARSFQIPQLFLELSVLDNALIALAVAAGYERVFLRPLKRPQASGYCDGDGRPSETRAARRTDQRRQQRRKVRPDGYAARPACPKRRGRDVRRARHGNRRTLRPSRNRLPRRTCAGRRRAQERAS